MIHIKLYIIQHSDGLSVLTKESFKNGCYVKYFINVFNEMFLIILIYQLEHNSFCVIPNHVY